MTEKSPEISVIGTPILYDDIYKQTIVEVIPLGQAESGAESMKNKIEIVRLALVSE